MKLQIQYHSEDYKELEKLEKGDWVDLRVDNIYEMTSKDPDSKNIDYDYLNGLFKAHKKLYYKAGDVITFGLGVSMALPPNFEAHVVPRSSTFNKWGFLLVNGIGVIDSSYCGPDDEWRAQFIALRDGVIERHSRVCQFRLYENQPLLEFETVDQLPGKNRGGFGSTGVK